VRAFLNWYNQLPHQCALLWAGERWRVSIPLALAVLGAEVWLVWRWTW
jgi:hypothetical protein